MIDTIRPARDAAERTTDVGRARLRRALDRGAEEGRAAVHDVPTADPPTKGQLVDREA